MSRRICVIAPMRNEGPFILEWLAWYRMLGFTDAIIATNHCTDHSPQLLDRLCASLPWVHHISHDPEPGESIILTKLAVARQHPAATSADWIFVCDVDEFLVIHKGDGRIDELIGPQDSPPDWTAMAINWRVFGTGGVKAFADEPVHRQFLYAVSEQSGLSTWVKTLFQKPMLFGKFADHGPAKFRPDLAGADWGTPPFVFVDANGNAIADWNPTKKVNRFMQPKSATHETAQVNHYMVRSHESWTLKAGTKSPFAGLDRYTKSYFAQADQAKQLDASAFRYAEAFDAEYAALMAIPGIARLHALCCADHLRAIFEKAGKDVTLDPRYQAFLDRAQAD